MEQDETGRAPNGQFPAGKSGNPNGRPPKQRRETRADGYVNGFTGHGTSRDRRTLTTHKTVVVSDIQAIDLRRGNWLAARICEALPEDAFRRGYTLKLEDPKIAKGVNDEIESLGFDQKFVAAWQMERACGGAALFPALEGAHGDLSEPLELDGDGGPRIAKVKAVQLFEPRELTPETWHNDIMHPKFGMPATYRLWPLSGGRSGSTPLQSIHESRLIIFPGLRITREALPGQRIGWGDSVLNRVAQELSDFGLSWGSAATILHNFSQRVIKYKNLAEILKETDGEALVEKRVRVMDMVANVLRALPLDADDELVATTVSVAGLSDLLIQFAQLIAAAADMPLTRLFGMSPAGMNATGEFDSEGWRDRVGGGQKNQTTRLEQGVRLILLSAEGPTKGEEPDVWSAEWKPLKTPSEKETAETRKLDAETDHIRIEDGVYSADDAAKSRFTSDTYGTNIQIDWKAREEQKRLDDERAAELDAATVAALGRDPAAKPDAEPDADDDRDEDEADDEPKQA